MPPRRGGRGRGKMRARPPQVIRNTMAELGMGSITTFELLAKAAAAQNADAARAYFPILEPEKKAKPMPMTQSELKLTQLAREMRNSIANSPVAITRQTQNAVDTVAKDLSALRNYFFPGAANSHHAAQKQTIWDHQNCWIVPEIIPEELKPSHVRQPKRQRKTPRIVPDEDDDDSSPPTPSILNAVHQGNANIQDSQNIQTRADDEDDADANPADPDRGEDDDDLELDADYQTGVRFDDDDGYEDPDSGAEEATF